MQENKSTLYYRNIIQEMGISDAVKNKLLSCKEEKLNDVLIEISASKLFEYHSDLFDVILTQENEESQLELFYALNSDLIRNNECIGEMLRYSNNPSIQRKLRIYYGIKSIIENEKYFIQMLNLSDSYVEDFMIKSFQKGHINNDNDFKTQLRLAEFKSKVIKKLKIKKDM